MRKASFYALTTEIQYANAFTSIVVFKHHDVLGLQIAMQNPLTVTSGKRIKDLTHHVSGALKWKRPLFSNQVAKVLALDELHAHEVDIQSRVVSCPKTRKACS